MADDRKPIIGGDSDSGSGYGATPYHAAPVSPYHVGYPQTASHNQQGPPQTVGAVPHPRTPQHAPPPPVGLPLGGTTVAVLGAPPAGMASPVSPAPHIGPYPPGVQPAAVSPPGVDSPTYAGPTSADFVQDDPNAKSPSPTAPPVELMDHIKGYDNVTFDSSLLPPPTYSEAQALSQAERVPLTNAHVINEEEARDALLQFIGEHCCYGKSAAKDMIFRQLQSTSAFHYSLETFCESRRTAWQYEPYRGQPVDSAMNGLAPGPWQVQVPYPEKFKDGDHRVEVPHTASVKPCHTCSGRGKTRCHRCLGRGQVICDSCNGAGQTHRINHPSVHGGHFGDVGHGSHGHGGHMGHDGLGEGHMGGSPHHHGHHRHHHAHHHHEQECETCNWCNGTGRKRCILCHGHGEVGCKTCQEAANLKCFIELTVTWTNHYDDFIVEKTELPDKLIRKVSGQTALDEENQRVWPINHFPDQAINQASNRLVQQHNVAFPNENILVQRQRVRIVPVTEVVYEWKEKTKRFFVYGFEHKVYAPDYPQKCCCGCSIL